MRPRLECHIFRKGRKARNSDSVPFPCLLLKDTPRGQLQGARISKDLTGTNATLFFCPGPESTGKNGSGDICPQGGKKCQTHVQITQGMRETQKPDIFLRGRAGDTRKNMSNVCHWERRRNPLKIFSLRASRTALDSSADEHAGP